MTSAIAIKGNVAPRALRAVPASGEQATLMAQFAQALTRALMQGVQDAASLNVATVRALLAPSDGGLQAEFVRATESWRFSWRTYEISATTAANVMRLSEQHARQGLDLLCDLTQLPVAGKLPFATEKVQALREAVDELRSAQLQAFESAVEVHRRLITLATAGAR